MADTKSTARGMIVNLPDILFDVSQSTLKPDAKLVIAKLAGILLIMQDLNLRVEGHTDSTGPYDYNMKLSEERARSVVQFLAEQGIAPTRMVAKGYGPDRPIATMTPPRAAAAIVGSRSSSPRGRWPKPNSLALSFIGVIAHYSARFPLGRVVSFRRHNPMNAFGPGGLRGLHRGGCVNQELRTQNSELRTQN